MKSKYVLGLMSLVVFTACGKSMQVTVKNQKVATDTSKMAKAAAFDGKLGALSAFDVKNLKDGYPFINLNDSDNAVRTVGSYAFSVDTSSGPHGFVKASNVVFRAIKQVPPLELIKSVLSLELHLRGVRLNSMEVSDKATLAKQVLCVLDTKQCIGEIPESNDQETSNLNAKFWGNKPVVSDSFSKISDLKLEHVLDDGSKIFTYSLTQAPSPAAAAAAAALASVPGAKIAAISPATTASNELVIDLKDAFGLKDDQAVKQWIYDNSTEYAAGGYRKFQFVIGNNLYVQEGELVLAVQRNDNLPADSVGLPGDLKNGPTDVAKDPGEAKPITVKEKADFANATISKDLSAALLGFDANSNKLSDAGAATIKELADKLKSVDCETQSLVIEGQEKDASLAQARADAVKDELVKDGVRAELLKTAVVLEDNAQVTLDLTLTASKEQPMSQAQVDQLAKDMTGALDAVIAPATAK